MRPILIGILACSLAAGLAVPTGAVPSTGDLTFASMPSVMGAVTAVGGGEVPLDGNVPANLAGTGSGMTLTRVWTERTVVSDPLGSDHSMDTPDERRETVDIGAAAFTLGATGEGFRGLLFMDDGGRLDGTAAHLEAPIEAFRAPQLVTDDYGRTREGESSIFTYTAEGDRFPIVLDALAAQGGFTVFLFDAELVVTDDAGDQNRYVSGATREPTGPGTYRVTHEHHLLHVTDGAATVTADAVLAWLDQPTLTIDGTMSAERASGQVDVDGDAHHLDQVSLTLGGVFDLRPIPDGEPVPVKGPLAHAGTRQPTEGRYDGARGFIDGEVSVLAIGGTALPTAGSDTGVVAATAVGLVGLGILFVPKVQWALAGLFAPLYAKTQRDRLLDNVSRDRIFQAIRSNPGINLSQIHRLVDLGWGVTVYHLKMMEKNDLIVSEASARDRCFFENDPRYIELREAIAKIANREPVQRIVRTVVAHPGLNQGEVIAATGLTQRTVSYYLGRLAKSDLVRTKRVKNYVHYQPTDQLRRALDVIEGSTEAEATPGGTTVPVHA